MAILNLQIEIMLEKVIIEWNSKEKFVRLEKAGENT